MIYGETEGLFFGHEINVNQNFLESSVKLVKSGSVALGDRFVNPHEIPRCFCRARSRSRRWCEGNAGPESRGGFTNLKLHVFIAQKCHLLRSRCALARRVSPSPRGRPSRGRPSVAPGRPSVAPRRPVVGPPERVAPRPVAAPRAPRRRAHRARRAAPPTTSPRRTSPPRPRLSRPPSPGSPRARILARVILRSVPSTTSRARPPSPPRCRRRPPRRRPAGRRFARVVGVDPRRRRHERRVVHPGLDRGRRDRRVRAVVTRAPRGPVPPPGRSRSPSPIAPPSRGRNRPSPTRRGARSGLARAAAVRPRSRPSVGASRRRTRVVAPATGKVSARTSRRPPCRGDMPPPRPGPRVAPETTARPADAALSSRGAPGSRRSSRCPSARVRARLGIRRRPSRASAARRRAARRRARTAASIVEPEVASSSSSPGRREDGPRRTGPARGAGGVVRTPRLGAARDRGTRAPRRRGRSARVSAVPVRRRDGVGVGVSTDARVVESALRRALRQPHLRAGPVAVDRLQERQAVLQERDVGEVVARDDGVQARAYSSSSTTAAPARARGARRRWGARCRETPPPPRSRRSGVAPPPGGGRRRRSHPPSQRRRPTSRRPGARERLERRGLPNPSSLMRSLPQNSTIDQRLDLPNLKTGISDELKNLLHFKSINSLTFCSFCVASFFLVRPRRIPGTRGEGRAASCARRH